MKTAAFIGVGNMGGALARAACRAVGADDVIISNRTREKAEQLAAELGCTAADSNEDAVRKARYIFLCVKPQMFAEVLKPLCGVFRDCHRSGEDKVLVSIAAGIKTAAIRTIISDAGYSVPVLRVMPNTCAAIGAGMLALCGEDGEALAETERILSEAGRVEQIPECLMDQFTAVAGCGPAYVYQFIEAMADGGVLVGLPRQQAQLYAAQTVLGAAAMVLNTGLHPGELKDAVCSPGGSTIAGVAELERHGVRAAVLDAIAEAYRRNTELGG